MLIDLVKFFHLIFALSLLGLTLQCVITKDSLQTRRVHFFTLSLMALISGTLLIYPKHFTFHTHWIMAAYILLFAFMLITFFSKKYSRLIYLILMVMLVLIVHDAVTKTTFF